VVYFYQNLLKRGDIFMKLLIGYDGLASADAIFDDLKHAGLPRDSEALVVSVGDLVTSNPPIREMAAQVFPSGAAAARLKQTMTYSERVKKETEDFAARAADRLRLQFPEWTVRSEAKTGTPSWEIMEAATRFNADLIVIGSQGRSMVGRMFLGSVSKQIAENADCSVRVARQADGKHDESPSRFIIGVNDSPTAVQAILSVGKRVWQDGTEVRLVAIDESASTNRIASRVPRAAEMIDSYQQSLTSKVRSILEWGAEELKIIGMKPSIWTRQGDPKQILVSEAKNWNADCIFVGTRGLNNFLERFRLGSVSTAVVTNAHCSVEIVRPPETTHE
jgi:nucleotide-binding universal stress UspA family protein